MVLLEPTTEVEISLYQLINGGVSEGGERHVNVKIVNGGVSFDVVPAESPPNTWAFLTPDGAVTIQGTGGSLSRRVGMKEELAGCSDAADGTEACDHPAATIDTKLELIEGTATMMRMKSKPVYDEDGIIQEDFEVEKELQAMVVKPGVAFQSAEEKPISAEMIEAVQTAADGNTVNLGFTGSGSQIGGTDVSGYVSNVDIDDNATNLSSGIGYLTPASTAANPVICTAEDTIDLELQATSTAPNAGKIRIFAVLMNIDSLGELGADEVDRDTLA